MKAIVKGWANFIWPNEKVENEAKRRAEICGGCEHNEHMKYEIIKDNRIEELTGHCCELCGCPLSTLLRQNDKTCEAGKW